MALGALVDYSKAPVNNCYDGTDDYGTQMQACGTWFTNIDVRTGANYGTSWTFTSGYGKTCSVPPGDPCRPQDSPAIYDLNGRDLGSGEPQWNTLSQHFTYDFNDHILSGEHECIYRRV